MRGARQGHQRRHVDIVPARVHSGSRGAEGGVGALLHGQAVELCPDRDRRPGSGSDARDAPGSGDRLAGHRKLRRHCLGCLLLGVGELRLGVQAVAQLDRRRQLVLELIEQPREQIVSRSRHSAGTPRPVRPSNEPAGR